jgi:hypothetical protein
MSPENQNATGVWKSLEEIYLASANNQASNCYANCSDNEQKKILKDFAQRQAVISKRWAQIVQDLWSANPDGWRQRS